MRILISYGVVFLGAGIGGALRHAVNIVASKATHTDLPIATLAVNVLGSFAAGALASYFAPRGNADDATRLFALTGVLGGFTTFSAFSLEAARLIERGSFSGAFGYAAGSVVLSIAGVVAGMVVARQ